MNNTSEFEPKSMPFIDLEALSKVLNSSDLQLVQGIVNNRGNDKGRLRASRPKIEYIIHEVPLIGRLRRPTHSTGCTAYIWRMVAFYASPIRQHQCMPVCAEFYLPLSTVSPEGKTLSKHLDEVVDQILATIPIAELHGVAAWGKALYGR